MLAAVLLIAFFAARTCASNETEVDQDEAVEIARNQVDFEPEKVIVRFVQQGLGSGKAWAVSLSTENAAGIRQDCATVLVDGETGEAKTEAC
jgi:hypothetical protein